MPNIQCPGAMWDANWFHGWDGRFNPSDGLALMVMTPGGEWNIDGPSNNGTGWTRTGVSPLVTANPSIAIGDIYHGWLRDGVLVDA